MTFTLTDDFIELTKLLKALDLVDSGGQAKMLIEQEQVFRNGKLETRKRAKILKGEQIQVGDVIIDIN
jgi:ribosome-associated protein